MQGWKKYLEMLPGKKAIPCALVVAFLPLVWMFVVAQHSAAHTWFTFRNTAGVVFPLLAFLTGNMKPTGDQPPDNDDESDIPAGE